jgi:hypothetical protein
VGEPALRKHRSKILALVREADDSGPLVRDCPANPHQGCGRRVVPKTTMAASRCRSRSRLSSAVNRRNRSRRLSAAASAE